MKKAADFTDENLKTIVWITVVGGIGFGLWRGKGLVDALGAMAFAWAVLILGVCFLMAVVR